MLEEINILIIEDNNGSVLLFNEVLNRSKRSATTFIEKSAESALYFLTHSKTRIDLILLDISMPKEDGWYVMNTLFNNDDQNNTPVIILTTSISINDRLKTRDFKNIIGFFNKPITVNKMNEIFDSYDRSQK